MSTNASLSDLSCPQTDSSGSCGYGCWLFWIVLFISLSNNYYYYFDKIELSKLRKELASVKPEWVWVSLVVSGVHYLCKAYRRQGNLVMDSLDEGLLRHLWGTLNNVYGVEQKSNVGSEIERIALPQQALASSSKPLNQQNVAPPLQVAVSYEVHRLGLGPYRNYRIVAYYAHGEAALADPPAVNDQAFTIVLSTTLHGERHTPQPGDTFVYHHGPWRQIYYCWGDRWLSDKGHESQHPDDKMAVDGIVLYAEPREKAVWWLKHSTVKQRDCKMRRGGA
ncbi:hypothetical protein PENSPDRAFT_747471 [Peniophora sp. CONT]|nr:hypothetical protein PENSPDRAFT_747471 [Peniophora sp. CONT]